MLQSRRLLSMVLLGVLCFLPRCNHEPAVALQMENKTTFRLNGQACEGKEIQGPSYVLETPGGRELILDIGSPGTEPVDLEIAGFGVFALKPADWTVLSLRPKGKSIQLSWQGGPLYLGQPYVKARKKSDQPNVLLLSIDTLRYDHFTKEHMPLTRALFERGEIFDGVYTPAPWTLPAHASLLTSLYPVTHGVRKPGQKLSPELKTLPGFFQDMGYQTLAFTEGNYVSSTFGLNLGFHRFVEDPPSMMDSDPDRVSRLAANLERARDAVKEDSNGPMFIFFHTYEVHCPYLPRNNAEDPDGLGSTQWLLDNDGKELDESTLNHLRNLYAQEVAYTDLLLAPFLEDLLERGNWVIALVSDHGDEFGEHGGLLHADTLYEEAVKVPFAMVGRGLGTASHKAPGSLVDAPATILTVLGLTPPDTWQGHDLRSSDPRTPVFSESFFFGPQIKAKDPRIAAVWRENHKLIQTRNFDEITAELFALEGDPEERRNLVETDIEKRDQLFLRMEIYLKGKGATAGEIGELTPEELETMRSLGYIK